MRKSRAAAASGAQRRGSCTKRVQPDSAPKANRAAAAAAGAARPEPRDIGASPSLPFAREPNQRRR